MKGWAFVEEIPNGDGELVNGPSVPPLGSGSARLVVDATGRQLLLNQAHAGTRLAEITTLGYSTYRTSGSPALAASLQLDIDTDVTDGNSAWQGRLVYEAYYTHSVQTGIWQTWNTLDDAPNGNWWFSGAPGNAVCSIGNPCTWSEVRLAFPEAGIRVGGYVNFKAGGPWLSSFDGNVDAFTIGVNNVDTTYNFEAVPTDKEQCKNGGWQNFSDPSFANQGLCIRYTNTGE
jgi:hypothetical protein